MPKVSTPFQAIVHLVRQQSAQPGVTITESRMLHDSRLGIDREVDIVIEGSFDGESVVTSVEVIEHGRSAAVTWVEQMIKKHQYLSTNRLVLVSKSGFTRTAIKAVAAEGGWVEALKPEILETDNETRVIGLHTEEIKLIPHVYRLILELPNGEHIPAILPPDATIFDAERNELGCFQQLAEEAMNTELTTQRLHYAVHKHEVPEDLQSFDVLIVFKSLGYYLHKAALDELHAIVGLQLEGDLELSSVELPFTAAALADRRYGFGQGLIFDRPAVWVRTFNKEGTEVNVSLRPTGKPNAEPIPPAPPLRFPGLRDLAVPPID